MGKSSKAEAKLDLITEEMEQLVLEIQSLVRVRNALSFGSKLSERDAAESKISRKINSKVLDLSRLVTKKYKGE